MVLFMILIIFINLSRGAFGSCQHSLAALHHQCNRIIALFCFIKRSDAMKMPPLGPWRPCCVMINSFMFHRGPTYSLSRVKYCENRAVQSLQHDLLIRDWMNHSYTESRETLLCVRCIIVSCGCDRNGSVSKDELLLGSLAPKLNKDYLI